MNTEQKDVPWEQQFSNFRKALAKLTIAIEIFKPNEEENLELEEVDDLLKDGMIRRFVYTHELAWNVMKEYAEYHGNKPVEGPVDSIHKGLKMGLIVNADEWMAMLESSNETSQLYDEKTTDTIFRKILESYYLLFLNFEHKMEELFSGKQGE